MLILFFFFFQLSSAQLEARCERLNANIHTRQIFPNIHLIFFMGCENVWIPLIHIVCHWFINWVSGHKCLPRNKAITEALRLTFLMLFPCRLLILYTCIHISLLSLSRGIFAWANMSILTWNYMNKDTWWSFDLYSALMYLPSLCHPASFSSTTKYARRLLDLFYMVPFTSSLYWCFMGSCVCSGCWGSSGLEQSTRGRSSLNPGRTLRMRKVRVCTYTLTHTCMHVGQLIHANEWPLLVYLQELEMACWWRGAGITGSSSAGASSSQRWRALWSISPNMT